MITPAAVIGVDPGKVAGCALYVPDTRAMISCAFPWLECCDWVDTTIRDHAARGFVILAVERFTMSSRGVKTSQPEALMMIGVMSWLARSLPNVYLIIQGAADAQAAAPKKVLQRIGWWVVADPDQHRNRASAQVALALLTRAPHHWADLTR